MTSKKATNSAQYAQYWRPARAAGALALLLSGSLMAAGPARANPATGIWFTEDRKAKIEVSECGESLCSKIVWLREPIDEQGRPFRDAYNPDPQLRRRRIIGIDIFKDLKPTGATSWTGEIYNPEDGKYYYLKNLALISDGTLEVKGCLSAGWPCRTKYWSRAEPAPAEPVVASAGPSRTESRDAQRQPAPQRMTRAPVPRPQSVPAPERTPQQRQAAVAPSPLPHQQAGRDNTGSVNRPMAVAPAGSGFHVQVLARPTQDEAMAAFFEMQRLFPQFLAGHLPSVQRADLGEKGVWYRVRIGPMGHQQAAVSFCDQLKAAGADCIVRGE